MRTFIKTRISEGRNVGPKYPFTDAFDMSADLRAHLENGLESVAPTIKANEFSKKRVAALESYKKAATALVPLLGKLEDALADIEDSV